MNEQLSVSAIQNGSVIDHIPANTGIRVLNLLGLNQASEKITVGLNLQSSRLNLKDIIKIEGLTLTQDHLNKVGLLAPGASINVIENYTITKKFVVEVPGAIFGTIDCPNSRCLTNHESIIGRFEVHQKSKKNQLTCYYCEVSFALK